MPVMEYGWLNMRTGEVEYRTGAPNAEEMRDFIPQNQAALSLYDLYRQMGDDHVEAARKVLEISVGARGAK